MSGNNLLKSKTDLTRNIKGNETCYELLSILGNWLGSFAPPTSNNIKAWPNGTSLAHEFRALGVCEHSGLRYIDIPTNTSTRFYFTDFSTN